MTAGPRNSRVFFYVFLIVSLTLLAYSFALQAHFKTLDDSGSIVNNEWIKSVEHIPYLLTHSFFGKGTYYRPLVSLSFMLEYHFFGLNAFYYYCTNMLLHAATALVVFFMMRRLWGREQLSFAVALLFALHPIQWEAVSNIPGRAILLAGFFVVLSFYLFLSSLSASKVRGLLALSCLAFALALLSKESAVILPFLMLAYLLIIRGPEALWRDRPWPLGLALLPYALMLGIYSGWRHVLGIRKFFFWNSPKEALLGFITFLRGVMTYFRLFFFPVDLHFDRSRVLLLTFWDADVFWVFSFYAALLALIWRFRKRIPAVIYFFILWFALELAPVSQLVFAMGVQPGRIFVAEHFLYLACIGFFATAVLGFSNVCAWAVEKKKVSPRAPRIFAGGIFLFFFLCTVQQNIYSSNEVAMLERTLELSPENTRIRKSLANAFGRLRRFDLAEENFRKALEIFPDDALATIGLAKALCDQGKFEPCLAIYESITDAGDFHDLLKDNIHQTYVYLTRRYEKMLADGRDDETLHFSLGLVYSRTGRREDAVRHYQRSLQINPEAENSLFNLAWLLDSLGEQKLAAEYYERLLALPGEKGQRELTVCQRCVALFDLLGDNNKVQINQKRCAEIEAAIK